MRPGATFEQGLLQPRKPEKSRNPKPVNVTGNVLSARILGEKFKNYGNFFSSSSVQFDVIVLAKATT